MNGNAKLAGSMKQRRRPSSGARGPEPEARCWPPPCSSQGQALGARFSGHDEKRGGYNC